MEPFKRRQEGPQASSLSSSMGGGPPLQLAPSSNGSISSFPAYGAPKRQRISPGVMGVEGDDGAPQEGGPQGAPRVLPVCLLVSDNIAGALIGKGGATVRDLERSTNARIFVQRNAMGPPELAAAKQALLDTVGPPPQSQALDVTKIVAIGGTKEEDVQAGLYKVLNIISTHPTHSGRAAAVLLVPHRSIGGIVGQRGRTIEELSQKTQTQIRVVPGFAAVSGDRALCITGGQDEHVAAAVQLLLQQLQQMLAAGRLIKQDFDYLITISSTAQPKATQTQIRVVPGFAAVSGDRALCITGGQDEHVAAAVQLLLQQLQQMLAAGRLIKQDFDYLITISSTAQPKALRGPRGPMGALPGGPPQGAPLPMGGASPTGPGGFFGVGMGAPGWGAPSGAGGPPGPQGVPGAGGMGGGAGCIGYRFVASVESCGGLGCSSVLCFVIPQRLAAWVVGPQGAHVRAIREETGAQIQVLDEVSGFTGEDARCVLRGPQGGGPSGGPSDGSEGGERFCMISGGLQAVCGAVLRLGLPLQEKLQQLQQQQQQQQPLRLLIPFRFVSPLIGSKGTVIREMQQKSGALIQISKTLGAPGGPTGGPSGGPTGGAPEGGPSGGGGAGGGQGGSFGWGEQQQQQGSSSSSSSSSSKALTPREQHRIISVEGPTAARLVALALIWQRILGVEYPDLYREGAPFICPSSLAEDLQQQGHDISKIMLPPPAARMQQQQQQQQQPYGGPDAAGAPYYDGASPTGGGAPWGAPQGDPMGGGQQRPWLHDDAAAAAAAAAAVGGGGWGGAPHDMGAPSIEQLEGWLRSFCCRVGPVQDMGALERLRETGRRDWKEGRNEGERERESKGREKGERERERQGERDRERERQGERRERERKERDRERERKERETGRDREREKG
ncbi:uncharacterized protein EMH_0059740 [Eimeria mitis]|uniref:K Homology domain-containing protein n=1 Tax=Eimeria mitis TaxID=44415 RepID=U6JYU1_9EIME|nr:uncharacterized protein EMH_0059740 [Eimeria mitis]CDJ30599.1 hypothetical protein, conserved [Eimeria mitis]